MKIIAVIPARYESSRFPGKPLADICGKPMIQWVFERVSFVDEIDEVYVATDDDRIFEAVKGFGGKAIMTGECSCGTDRVYQAVKDIDADIIINIQGDEPLIDPEMVRNLITAFDDNNVVMATLKKKITNSDDIDNPNVVKVIDDNKGDAIYFSRFSIPYNRDDRNIQYYKHIGIYGYRKEFLNRFVSLPKGMLEISESLEQLRALENGYKIRVHETDYQSIGVDVPEDINKVTEQIEKLM
jgi:3-deoxy-manno-octulosonate cytidylyltransferase (CMP-KDO synthetase)